MSINKVIPTVLIVDDDKSIREMLDTCLRNTGYEVVTASDGKEAVSVSRETNPDLVITDIFMPGMDGLELIRYLRTNSPATRIIAISEMGDYLKTAQLLGAHAVLRKPLHEAKLLELIDQQIGGKEES
jgi:CheY-like chemotaxis protein